MSLASSFIYHVVVLASTDFVAARVSEEAVLAAHALVSQMDRPRNCTAPPPNPKEAICIITNCGTQMNKCVGDHDCRSALGCSFQKRGKMQCTSDYENQIYFDLVYCMFNEHDCMGTKKCFDPYQMCRSLNQATPMPTYRGQALTKEVARHLLMRGTSRGDWMVAMGKSPAFDCFDCQYFYWGYNPDHSMYYHADYKIHKNDGGIRWLHIPDSISVELNNTAGRYSLIFPNDNGLYREDDWRMLAADETNTPPQWIVLYYCGGVPGVADAYEGGVVLTPDGQVPHDPKAKAIIEAVFAKGNMTFKCVTNNSNCTGHPQPPSMSSALVV